MSLTKEILRAIKNKQEELKSRVRFSGNLIQNISRRTLAGVLQGALRWALSEAKDLIISQLPENFQTGVRYPTLALHWFTFHFNPNVYNRPVKKRIYRTPSPLRYPLRDYDLEPTQLLSGVVYPAPGRIYIVRPDKNDRFRLTARVIDSSTEEGIRYIWGKPSRKPEDTLRFEALRGLGKDDLIDIFESGVPVESSLVEAFRTRASIGFEYAEDLRKPIQVDRINRAGIVNSETDLIRDFVTFYFRSVVTGKVCQYRAFISSFGESTNTSYNSQDYVFNIIKMYSYINVETTYNISFMLYPMNREELTKVWAKLSFLKAHLFPARRVQPGGNFVPPILEITLGNVWRKRKVLLNGLNINFDESNVWELEEGIQLPQWIKVDLNLTLLYESNITTEDALSNRAPMFDYSRPYKPSALAAAQTLVDPATGVRLAASEFNYPEEQTFNQILSRLDVFKNIG